MKFTFENQGNSTYLVAELPADLEVDSMALGMITNNNIAGIAPAVFTQLDETKYVKYNITSKVSLKQLFDGQVNRKRVLDTFGGICEALLTAEDYMIDFSSFLYDMEKIYVNVSTAEVALICVPVMGLEQNIQDVGALFKNIMFSVKFDPTENTDYVGKILNYLNSAVSFSLIEFKGVLNTLDSDIPQPQNTEEKKTEENPSASKPEVRLVQIQQPVVQNVQTTISAPGRQSSLKSDITIPSVDSAAPQNTKDKTDKKEKREKKIFGLFGNKEAKPSRQNEGKKGKETKNVTIPNGTSTSVPNMAIPGMTPTPKSQISGQMTDTAPQEASMITPLGDKPTNFGETTVLGGGAAIGETTVLNVSQAANTQPYLIRLKTNEQIPLTKPVFKIGKEKSYVDYFISDNSAISRSHANLLMREGKFYVVDTNSTNHTYVDGRLLQSNVETEIIHGARIKLANEDFEFRAY